MVLRLPELIASSTRRATSSSSAQSAPMLGESGSKLAAFLYLGDSFAMPPQRGQVPTVPLVRDRIARAKLNSSRELSTSRLRIPVEVVQAKSKRYVSFAEITIQRYGLGRRRLRFRIRSSVCKMSSLSSHSVKARVSRIPCCRVHSLQAWRFAVPPAFALYVNTNPRSLKFGPRPSSVSIATFKEHVTDEHSRLRRQGPVRTFTNASSAVA